MLLTLFHFVSVNTYEYSIKYKKMASSDICSIEPTLGFYGMYFLWLVKKDGFQTSIL